MRSFRLLLLYAFLAQLIVPLYSFAQSISPFEFHDLMKNTSYEVFLQSTNNGITVINNVNNGSLSISNQPVSGSNYLATYTPDQGFIGRDTLTYQYWVFTGSGVALRHKSLIFDVKAFFLNDDYYIISLDDGEVYFDVLANDESNSTLQLYYIPLYSKGTAEISNDNQIRFIPTSTGYANLKYVACDEDGDCGSASVLVHIKESESDISGDTIRRNTLRGKAIPLFLTSPLFELETDASNGAVEFTSDVQIKYTPNSGFVGQDTIVFSALEDEFVTVFIVNVIDFNVPNTVVVDDQFFTAVNQPVSFNVQDNDFTQNFPISDYTQVSNGSLIYLGSGNFEYTPNEDFRGTDVFTYKICPLQQNCETGIVRIDVDNQMPLGDSYQFITALNTPYLIQYIVPITSHEFEITDFPINGVLDYYPGQQTVSIQGQSVSGYNLLVYEPNTGFLGVDEMRVTYCAGGDCKSIKIDIEVVDFFPGNDCFTDCVWPGDINNDGRVDMYDLFPLAYHLGDTGFSRDDNQGDISWHGVPSSDWYVNQIQSNVNLKHADADGDGIIMAYDTSAIVSNYLNYHRFIAPTHDPLIDIPFVLDTPEGPVSQGDTVQIGIGIGNEAFPALDFVGTSFQLDFIGADFIDPSSVSVSFLSDSWLSEDGPALNLCIQPNESRMDAALARADGRHTSGFGVIAQLEFIVVKDIDGFHIGNQPSIPIRLINGAAVLADGTRVRLPGDHKAIAFSPKEETYETNTTLNVFPNPAADEVTISVEGSRARITDIEVISMTGSLVQFQSVNEAKSTYLDLSSVRTGLYVLRVQTTKGVLVHKLQVVR